jgi:hypothetical protein
LQAKFLEAGSAWFRPIYFAGAFLAMFGTLYGTIEVAPTVAREMFHVIFDRVPDTRRLHAWITTWVGIGASAVLLWSYAWIRIAEQGKPPGLIPMLDPANLFTGVLACGLITGLACWSEWRYVPRSLRAPVWLFLLNLGSTVLFLLLGIKAYWDYAGSWSIAMLAATIGAGWIAASIQQRSSLLARDG